MTQDEIFEMARRAKLNYLPINETENNKKKLIDFAKLVAQHEREACEALHDHEDVQAPVGNSSWGEAYQEGWGQGTAAYRDAIRARGQV